MQRETLVQGRKWILMQRHHVTWKNGCLCQSDDFSSWLGSAQFTQPPDVSVKSSLRCYKESQKHHFFRSEFPFFEFHHSLFSVSLTFCQQGLSTVHINFTFVTVREKGIFSRGIDQLGKCTLAFNQQGQKISFYFLPFPFCSQGKPRNIETIKY